MSHCANCTKNYQGEKLLYILYKNKKKEHTCNKEIISKGGEKMKMVKEWILILLVILFSYGGFLFVSVPLWLFGVFLEKIKKDSFE